MELEVGDVVLCTVNKIAGTVVFVKIEGNGEGSIITSEITPGRIRNLRDYVVPKKKIVCKVLRISGNQINLSLRRVTQKERKEVLDKYKQEKSYKSILKSVLKEKAEPVIENITKQSSLFEFLQGAKENSKELENSVGKANAEKILEILMAQKQKKAIAKREFSLTSTKSDGIELIKKILGKIKEAKIKYISAGKYSIKKESENMKLADNELQKILEQIKEQAKKEGMEFQVKEK